MKKKFTLFLIASLILVGLTGCEKETIPEDKPVSTPMAEVVETTENTMNKNEEYLPCFIEDNGLYFFNITMDKFIENYNTLVEEGNEDENVKDLMKLNTSPIYMENLGDGSEAYNVTSPVLLNNRNSVNIIVTKLVNSPHIYCLNFVVPEYSQTDISGDMIKAVLAVTDTLDDNDEALEILENLESMCNKLYGEGKAYYKGLFMGYYERDGVRIYRIGAMDEETFKNLE